MFDNILKAIRSKLVAAGVNGGVRIYFDLAPDSAAYPYVLIRYITGQIDTIDSADIYNDVWQVSAFTDDPSESLTAMDDIKTALHRQSLSITDGNHLWMAAQTPFRLIEVVNGTRVYQVGLDFFVQSQDKS